MKVQLSDHSKQVLKEINAYYVSISRRKAGLKLRAKILNKILKLKDFPALGPIEEQFEDLNMEHRYLVEGQYKIIYCRLDDTTILVTDIFDTRQDPKKMLG